MEDALNDRLASAASNPGRVDRIGGTVISIVISTIVIVFSLPIFTTTALFGIVIYLLAFAQLVPLIRSDDRSRGPLRRGGGMFAPYVAGFTFAMPLAFFMLAAGAALAPDGGGVLASPGAGPQLLVVVLECLAAILLVHLCFVGIGFYHAYVTPALVEGGFGNEPQKKGFAVMVEVLAMQFLMVSFCLAAPLGTIGIALLLTTKAAWFPCVGAWFALACAPSILVGMALVDRGLHMRALRSQISNLATSRLASAAQGLVEVRGTVTGLPRAPDGPRDNGEWLLIEDADGGVARLQHPTEEERDIAEPAWGIDAAMPSGRPVLVLGEFVQANGESLPCLRPWVPPRGSVLRRFLAAFVGRAFFELGRLSTTHFPLGRLLQAAFGIPFLRGIYLVTDRSEAEALRLLLGKWRANVGWGVFYLTGAAGMLFVVFSGALGRFLS